MKTLVIIAIFIAVAVTGFNIASKKIKSIDKEKMFSVNTKTTDKISDLKEKRRQQIESMKQQNKKLQEQRVQSYQ